MFKAKVFNEKTKNKLKIVILLPVTTRFLRQLNFSINYKFIENNSSSKLDYLLYLNKIIMLLEHLREQKLQKLLMLLIFCY